MHEAYDYSQLSAHVAITLRRHIKAAVDAGTDLEDAAILASMAAMTGPIGTLAKVMGREMPTEPQVKEVINELLERLRKLPAAAATGGKDAKA